MVLDPVVITATGTPVPVSKTLANVIVIGRAEIEQSQAVDVLELLQFYAGFDIDRAGGPGQLGRVRLRGAEADQVLVLVDGVRMTRRPTARCCRTSPRADRAHRGGEGPALDAVMAPTPRAA